MWSIGCILVEFCTGDALFQTHDNLEHMAMMEPICGKIGIKMIKTAAKATQQKLFKDFKLDYPNAETTKQSRKYVRAMRPLRVLSRLSNFVSYFRK
jgi:dual-specificity kinase